MLGRWFFSQYLISVYLISALPKLHFYCDNTFLTSPEETGLYQKDRSELPLPPRAVPRSDWESFPRILLISWLELSVEPMGASWLRGDKGSGSSSLAQVPLPGPWFLLKAPLWSSLLGPGRGLQGCGPQCPPTPTSTGWQGPLRLAQAWQGRQQQDVTLGRTFSEQITTRSFGIERIDKQEEGEVRNIFLSLLCPGDFSLLSP